jgi:hypothetical protein
MGDDERDYIARAIGDLQDGQDRLHERIDRHAERTDHNFERVMAKQDLTNGRVTRTEKGYERVVGGIVVIGLFLSAHFLHF